MSTWLLLLLVCASLLLAQDVPTLDDFGDLPSEGDLWPTVEKTERVQYLFLSGQTSQTRGLYRLDLDGSNFKTVATSSSGSFACTVDDWTGIVYWSGGDVVFQSDAADIKTRGYPNRSERERLTPYAGYVPSLAAEANNSFLYIATAAPVASIYRLDTGTGSSSLILSGTASLGVPTALAVEHATSGGGGGDMLFWIDPTLPSIRRYTLATTTAPTTVLSGSPLVSPAALALHTDASLQLLFVADSGNVGSTATGFILACNSSDGGQLQTLLSNIRPISLLLHENKLYFTEANGLANVYVSAVSDITSTSAMSAGTPTLLYSLPSALNAEGKAIFNGLCLGMMRIETSTRIDFFSPATWTEIAERVVEDTFIAVIN